MGNLSVNSDVTPLMTYWLGLNTNRSFTLLTGEENVDLAGVIHHIDDDGPDVWIKDKYSSSTFAISSAQ